MPADNSPGRRPEAYLRSLTRIFWVLLTLALGLVPSTLFFVWIERNMALPIIGHELVWPWVMLWDLPSGVRLAWDFGLFLAFGFFHSALAQRRAQAALRRVLPVQCVRAFYLCFTGVSAFFMMALWQNTGVILWRVPGLSAQGLSVLSICLFYPLLFASSRVMAVFDSLEFLGFRQLYSLPGEIDSMSSGGTLLEHGFYGRVRHPIYFFTLLAILLAPMMSLDRLILLAAAALYLVFAIPVEERKLEARFGEAYRQYRLRVPAVLPRLRA